LNIKKFRTVKNKKKGILYIIDLDSNLDHFQKLYNYLDKEKYNLFLKFKPQKSLDSNWKIFCNKNNIIFFENDSLSYILSNYKISFFVASISSLLLESSLHNCIPIKIKTPNDFFDDVIGDKVVQLLELNKFSKINFLLDNMLTIKGNLISKINKKVWSIKNKKNNINNFCDKFNS
jgi:hypothetical protein